jgi:hypothetical protein
MKFMATHAGFTFRRPMFLWFHFSFIIQTLVVAKSPGSGCDEIITMFILALGVLRCVKRATRPQFLAADRNSTF